MITNETPEEREEFNRVERESKAKQESIRGTKHPTREQLMAEVAVLTELVRVLSDRVAELEKPWVGLSEQDINELKFNLPDMYYWVDVVRATEKRLKELNT